MKATLREEESIVRQALLYAITHYGFFASTAAECARRREVVQAVVDAIDLLREHHADDFYGFAACAACRAKPGAPSLCASCVHNRALLADRFHEISELRAKVSP